MSNFDNLLDYLDKIHDYQLIIEQKLNSGDYDIKKELNIIKKSAGNALKIVQKVKRY